jgi:hypothetical protein
MLPRLSLLTVGLLTASLGLGVIVAAPGALASSGGGKGHVKSTNPPNPYTVPVSVSTLPPVSSPVLAAAISGTDLVVAVSNGGPGNTDAPGTIKVALPDPIRLVAADPACAELAVISGTGANHTVRYEVDCQVPAGIQPGVPVLYAVSVSAPFAGSATLYMPGYTIAPVAFA